ncbi:MAG: peptidyl-prolyl cis-trans isomerase [Melioribacteraceae bacterium]|nr:peptidyl-prolyl cis-trans isomerase [Melioribacteraceae bacterium]
MSLKKISFLLGSLLLIVSCETEKKEKKFIAKTDDSLLTVNEILDLNKTDKNERLVKGELVRNWANSNVIDKEAEFTGIYDSEEFKELMQSQKIKFAESILFSKYFEENYEEPTNEMLQAFYFGNKENFVIQDEGFVLNVSSFFSEDDAAEFRNELNRKEWNKVFDQLSKSEKVKASIQNRFFYTKDFYNQEILNLVNQMEEEEVSIILSSEPNDFKIFQLVRKFDKYSIPDFIYIEEIVNDIYKVKRTKELYQEFLNNLYEKYNVEIKTEQE